MKIRQLISIFVWISLVNASWAQDANLNRTSANRRSVDGAISAKKAQKLRENRIEEIRAKLTSPSIQISGVEKIFGNWGIKKSNPITSSFFFKEVLSTISSKFLIEIKYGTPIPIDPTMTPTQLDSKLRLSEMQFCIGEINKKGYNNNKESELNELFTSIMHKIVIAKKNKKEKPQSDEAVKSLQPTVNVLKSHLEKAPRNNNGQSILDIFGNLHDFDLYKDRIRRIMFTKDKNISISSDEISEDEKISLSLSMLASMRTRTDEAFVRLHQCLVTYLNEQKTLFEKRFGDIKSYRTTASSHLFSEAGLVGKSPKDIDLNKLPRKKVKRQAYLLKYFYEGHSGFANFEKEREFISSRLAKITIILPYLQERLRGAIKAHATLAQLNIDQMDFLIDMFLQLKRDDIPVEGTVDQLRDWAMNYSERKDLMEDYVYYRQLDRDLIALENYLDEEVMMKKAKEEDLNAIRQLAN